MARDLLSKLLQEQYSITEQYCNSEIALRNAIVGKQGSIDEALRHQREQLERVQEHFQALRQFANDHPLLKEHVERTRRVLRAVAECYHLNGLPVPSPELSTNHLVSLSTLRASIKQVQELSP